MPETLQISIIASKDIAAGEEITHSCKLPPPFVDSFSSTQTHIRTAPLSPSLKTPPTPPYYLPTLPTHHHHPTTTTPLTVPTTRPPPRPPPPRPRLQTLPPMGLHLHLHPLQPPPHRPRRFGRAPQRSLSPALRSHPSLPSGPPVRRAAADAAGGGAGGGGAGGRVMAVVGRAV